MVFDKFPKRNKPHKIQKAIGTLVIVFGKQIELLPKLSFSKFRTWFRNEVCFEFIVENLIGYLRARQRNILETVRLVADSRLT